MENLVLRSASAHGLMARFEGLIYFVQLMTEITSLAGLTQGLNLAVEHCALKAAEHVHFILLTRLDKVWIANVNFGGLCFAHRCRLMFVSPLCIVDGGV